jgi:hypothetical protein
LLVAAPIGLGGGPCRSQAAIANRSQIPMIRLNPRRVMRSSSVQNGAGLLRPYKVASRFFGNHLPAIEAPEKAPMLFMRMSVIVGYRTGENTWYSSHVMDTITPTSVASHIDLTPAIPRILAYAKPKGM